MQLVHPVAAIRGILKRRVVVARRSIYFFGYLKSLVLIARFPKLAQSVPSVTSVRGRVEAMHVCFASNFKTVACMLAIMAAVSFPSLFFIFHLNAIKRIR